MKLNKDIIKQCALWGVNIAIITPQDFNRVIKNKECSRAGSWDMAVMFPRDILLTPAALKDDWLDYKIIHELGHLVHGKHTSTYIDETNAGQLGFEYMTYEELGMDCWEWFECWDMKCGKNKCFKYYRQWHYHKLSCMMRRLSDSLIAAEKNKICKRNKLMYRKL